MTETERWVNETCERIMASRRVRLYRDLYRDLRERLPCGVACRLIAEGLHLTRDRYSFPAAGEGSRRIVARARAIAALARLERWAQGR